MLRQPKRPRVEYYSKWDPKNRQQTSSPEVAEKILQHTGRLPRPLRLCDVKTNAMPMKKSIVATPAERRKAAEMVGLFSVNRLQARLLLRREFHPVWGHERIMVYGKMVSNHLQPCANTNEPFEVETPLKFKAAFREDFDPYFPTKEAQWTKELQRRGLPQPDLIEGKMIEKALKGSDPALEVPENVFAEAILDNVVDLGELVLQHFACHIDLTQTGPESMKHKLNKRMSKRLRKEMGMHIKCDVKEKEAFDSIPSAQEIHDYGNFPETKRMRFPKPWGFGGGR